MSAEHLEIEDDPIREEQEEFTSEMFSLYRYVYSSNREGYRFKLPLGSKEVTILLEDMRGLTAEQCAQAIWSRHRREPWKLN